MKNKYKILILSNLCNEEFIEDEYIAKSFIKDGHRVDFAWVDYDEKMDNEYDVIIRRNTWVNDKKETEYYSLKNKEMVNRLKEKNKKTVNLEGLDYFGKEYMCRLYKDGKKVIPSVDTLEEINILPIVDEYVLKECKSFGSGLGQKIVKSENLKNEFEQGFLIEPRLKFKSEVQCHFVGNKLMYVHEYIPSKYPDYPMPKVISLSEDDEKLAYEFAIESCSNVGFKRIDFLKLENDELILLEIEDNSPHMSLEILNEELRNKVINEYKENIYNYLERRI